MRFLYLEHTMAQEELMEKQMKIAEGIFTIFL